jgi:hypothetical protein
MFFRCSPKARQVLGLKDYDLIVESGQDAKSFDVWYYHMIVSDH